jgi:hypothetical protein
MMDKQKLRGADILTSGLLILFGAWLIFEGMGMPMTASYGGVKNVWYVAPALFPLIIGGAMILMSISLLVAAMRLGGWPVFVAFFAQRGRGLDEKGWRFIGILLPLFSLVFLNIPNLDFILSNMLFLIFFITVFYIDDLPLMKKAIRFYGIGMLGLLVLHASGLTKALKNFYVVDLLALGFVIAFILYVRSKTGDDRNARRKLRNSIIISTVIPVLLVAAFRFFLMVPMPVEGGLLDLLYIIRYAFK